VAYINASDANSFVTLVISTATISSTATTGMIVVPGLQNITVNNGNGVFRWKQLDSGSEKAIATPATNQIALNIVLDPTTFFGSTTTNQVTAAERGLFKLSNDKTLLYFRMYWNSTTPGAGSKYITAAEGSFITGLSPTVSPDSPVWVSPLTLDVVGEFTAASV
jgi:hypothetical protein